MLPYFWQDVPPSFWRGVRNGLQFGGKKDVIAKVEADA